MLKRLSKCIREYMKYTAATPILVTLEVIMEVLMPLIMAQMIDKGIGTDDKPGSMKMIFIYGGLLLLCALLSMVFGGLAGKTAATASCGFAKNLRQDMFYRIQNFSFSNIDRFSTAGLVTRLTTDVTNVQMAFQMLTRMTFRAPVMLVTALIAAFSLNVRLSLIYLCVTPVLFGGLLLIIKFAHPIFTRVFKTYDKLNGAVGENLSGVRVVKSFNREDYETKKFKGISGGIFSDFVKAEKLIAFNFPLMNICMYTCVILISWFGAKFIVASGNTDFTTGMLTSFFTYNMQILFSLMMISVVFVMMTISRASAERIYEVFQEESDIVNPDNPVTEVENGDISFENVSFGYSRNASKKCLDNINVTIKSGETVGILGATGSAKSTFVSLIPRLYDAGEGVVKVAGRDVREYDIEALRDSVAMVLQKNVLFSGTIKENLRWGNADATDEEIKRVCRLAQADGFIEAFPDKYDTYIEQGGTNVSGGQKQRLCIARALLKKPKILILDDSTSAVDTKTDALIRQAFAEEIPDTTKIIIAQRVSSVMDADKIIVMDDGKIASMGTHEELLENEPIYREVYESQVKGGEENE
ncbi:MAG: ABC transporter ATP-binding protein [Ruminococcaceae bacterium]|nr:ABC transporter ATP-binding protein [Oscillospiraceae bacterium]